MYFVGFTYLVTWVIAEPHTTDKKEKSHDFLCPYAKKSIGRLMFAKQKKELPLGLGRK